MPYKKLTDKHPTSIKLELVFDEMVKQGISFRLGPYGRIYVNDTQFPNKEFMFLDMEQFPSDDHNHPGELPYNFEYKLVYQDD